MLHKGILMAKAKQNLNLKIQMLAKKGTNENFEKFYKNLGAQGFGNLSIV